MALVSVETAPPAMVVLCVLINTLGFGMDRARVLRAIAMPFAP